MPYKDQKSDVCKSSRVKASTNWRVRNRDRDNENVRKRREKRRNDLIEHLGGKCVGCGVTTNLQFDHIDRTQKSFSVGSSLGKSWSSLFEEVEKCQLLCNSCHSIKTSVHHDTGKLAEGYRVESVQSVGDKILVTLSK